MSEAPQEQEQPSNRLNKPVKLKPADAKAARQAVEVAHKAKLAEARASKGSDKWPAYTGKAGLPKDQVVDKKGKVHKPGSTQFAVRRSGNTAELMGYYRNGKGVASKLIMSLKLGARSARGEHDRAMYNELKVSKVPGAF